MNINQHPETCSTLEICIYRAPDSLDNMNDLIINVFIYASDLNDNVKIITRDFIYPGTNWNNSSFQSCNDEFSLTIKMNCRSW